MDNVMYIRMRHRVQVTQNQVVTVGDVAQVVGERAIRIACMKQPIHHVTVEDQNRIIIDVMSVIALLKKVHPELDLQTVGSPQTILQVEMKTSVMKPVYFFLIWLLLFIGAGLAIMNFHEDVSMLQVHQALFTRITGNEKAKPLLLQIPYSIGLGLGMIIFFNHLFKKRINEEPSPLEVEMFNYQQAMDQYVILHENKESETKINGR
ncbi:stage V sporulation protein AA [Halalkalibacterium ligniniphilum]|uniref:stage V sporulation protein AA n=1 Tax=Halalkalibacterium ligniniphilum TaxID=1134413 RepID=UPI00036FA44B|nr:stage V sporulation protein AA [Halalkalibacterium ligniniphilum]